MSDSLQPHGLQPTRLLHRWDFPGKNTGVPNSQNKRASLVAQTVKCLAAKRETWLWFWSGEDPLEKEMATHSSTLTWKIPWMENTGRLQSMGSQRVRHNWVTFHFHRVREIEEKWSRGTTPNSKNKRTPLKEQRHRSLQSNTHWVQNGGNENIEGIKKDYWQKCR